MSSSVYDAYADWKKWASEDFMRYDAYDTAYFAGELKGYDVKGRNVLELGFGNGKFLAFARDRGAHVAGTELLAEAIEMAKARDLRVFRPDLADAVETAAGQFDLVVAFDVLEHLTHEDIKVLFAQLARVLRPGGVVLARFPNGQSPLGCISQYGDHTHRSVLSAQLLMQLLLGGPWKLLSAGNPHRVNIGNPIRRLGLGARTMARNSIEALANSIYGTRMTLDPNVVVRIAYQPPPR